MGEMRFSKATNTLVIVTDHTKGLYDDKWVNDTLFYTGMGKSGDQSLNFSQNKRLAESNINGVVIHLFEVLRAKEYTYKGIVKLCTQPYKSIQMGKDGLQRKVWIFPLGLLDGNTPIDIQLLADYEANRIKATRKLAIDELRKRAEETKSSLVGRRATTTNSFLRDPSVAEYVKRIANGHCQLCGGSAPFTDRNNEPYLESHHIIWLSRNGEDSIKNTVALCPNCHRKMHVLDIEEDKIKLITIASQH